MELWGDGVMKERRQLDTGRISFLNVPCFEGHYGGVDYLRCIQIDRYLFNAMNR